MARTYVPVNGEVVRWAVDESGLSVADLAEKANLEATAVRAWIEGAAQPTKGEFTRLVRALKRPSALFFAKRVPESSALPESLRSAPGKYGHSLAEGERRWVRRALRLQKLLSFLGSQRGASVTLPRVSRQVSPESAATTVREWLGVSVEEQVAQDSGFAAWSFWRERLEQSGFLVFVLQLGPDNIRGFSSWDDVAPVIAVNSAYNPQARVFTAFHELGHLALRSRAACADLAWSPGAPGPGSNVLEERWCEEFAASALLPRRAVMEFAYETRPQTDGGFDLAKEVAEHFNVSIRAAAVRLIRLEIEDQDLYGLVNEKARVWDRTKGFARGRPPSRVQRRVAEYGDSTVKELFLGTTQGLLNLRDLRDYLRVDTTEVDEIAQLIDVGR
jgi:Zn-dependent peptidase ImmA (M78 family)